MATVDKVSVKVIPDTSGFARQMRAELAAIQQQLTVPVRLDTSGIGKDMAALRRKVASQPIQIPVSLGSSGGSAAGLSQAISGLAGAAEAAAASFAAMATAARTATHNVVRMRRATAAVVGQTLTWAGHMTRLVARVETARRAWQGLSRSVTIVSAALRRIPELAGLARNLALSARSAARLAGVRLDVLVARLQDGRTYSYLWWRATTRLADGITRVAEGFQRLRSIRLSDVAAGIRRIGTSLRNAASSAARLGRTLRSGLGRATDFSISGLGKGLAGALSGMASLARKTAAGFGRLTRSGAGLAAALAALAPAIGLVSSALAALPGVLAGLGAGIGAIALGMDGIKAAVQAAAPALQRLKAAVSGVFQAQLTPVFQRIATVLLPGITAGMQGIARGISQVAAAFVGVLTSAQGMRQITAILANVEQFLTAVVPATRQFTQAMLTLAQVGSGAFVGLAAGISRWVAQFSRLIQTAARTGLLRNALAGLGRILGALGSVFTQVFAAGLRAMAQLGGPVATLIRGFGRVLTALMPLLTSLATVVAQVLGAAFAALAPVIRAITPSLTKLATMLGTLLVGAIKTLAPILTAVATILNDVLLMALRAIQPILPPLIQFFTRMGRILGQTLLKLFQALRPTIAQIARSFGKLLLAITPLLPQIANLVVAILPPLVRIIRAIAPLLTDIVRTALPILVDVIKMVIPVIGQLVAALAEVIPFLLRIGAAILEWLVPKMQLVYRVIREVWPKAKGIIQGAMDAISGIIKTVMGIITLDWERAWEGLKDFAEGIIDGIVSVFRTGKHIISSITGGIGDLFSMARSDAQSAVDATTRAARGMSGGARTMSAQLSRDVRTLARTVSTPTMTLAAPAPAVPLAGAGVLDATPRAVAAAEDLRAASPQSASGDWSRSRASEQDWEQAVGAAVERALSGWQVVLDRHGITKLVNTTNRRNARR